MFLCSPADVSGTSGRTEAQEERGGSEERQSGDQRTSRCPDAAALWIVRRLVHRCRCIRRTHQRIQAPEGVLNDASFGYFRAFCHVLVLPICWRLWIFSLKCTCCRTFPQVVKLHTKLGKPIPSTEPVFVSSAPAVVALTTSKTATTTAPTPASVVQKTPAAALSKPVASPANKPATAKAVIIGKWPNTAFSLNEHNQCLCKSCFVRTCDVYTGDCEFIINVFVVATLCIIM